MKYDWLVVGAGLCGAVFARAMTDAGQRVLVVDRRDHIAGNVYTEDVEGITVHRCGAHIFHTDDSAVWAYVSRFANMVPYVHAPVAEYDGRRYTLPINMHTFRQMWDVKTPDEARTIIAGQRPDTGVPRNLEEQAICSVGTEIYEKLIKGYTEKQWGRPCTALPTSIIQRLPVRFDEDGRYFCDAYQGVPEQGYTPMIARMLEAAEVKLGVDYLTDRADLDRLADRKFYTGPIDAYFGCRFGPLQYRSVRFETQLLETGDYQGAAVVNYTDSQVPYTRIIEHKYLGGRGPGDKTVISREYSFEWVPGAEPAYPINDAENGALYRRYAALASGEKDVIFCGRLAEYRYYDMDDTVKQALEAAKRILAKR